MTQTPDITLAVKKLLLADSRIESRTAKQVFVNRLPQTTSNNGAIVLWVVSSVPWQSLEGTVGIDQDRIQFDAYAVRQEQSRELAWLVWQILDNFSGVSDGVHILSAVRSTGIRDETDRVKMGTDQYRFYATQDITFTYRSCAKVQI